MENEIIPTIPQDVDDSKKRKFDGDQKTPKRGASNPKKHILIISYIGTNFAGIQINPGVKNIEDELLNALDAVGALKTKNTKDKHALEWYRACRTDKGVHAARNIVTARLFLDVAEKPDFIQNVNDKLSPDVRLVAIQRVDAYFHPKNHCRRRTYLYAMPTWILSSEKRDFSKDDLDRLNRILSKYVGTHAFHNFTVKVKPTDQQAIRVMFKLEASEPVMISGKEYVIITVYGASFMLHQIRRMMGLVIAVMRGKCDEGIMEIAMDKKYFVKVPEAPGHCLVLDSMEFPSYDGEQAKKTEEKVFLPLDWKTSFDQIEKYKREVIFPEIVRVDVEKLEFADWLFLLTNDQHGQCKIGLFGQKIAPVEFSDISTLTPITLTSQNTTGSTIVNATPSDSSRDLSTLIEATPIRKEESQNLDVIEEFDE